IRSPPSLEPEVVKRVSRIAVVTRSRPVVAPPGGEVAHGDPGACAVAGRGPLLATVVGGLERPIGLVEQPPLPERATEDELGRADLVQEVDPALEERDRLPREPLRLLVVV